MSEQIIVELSGKEIENKIIYYKEKTKQLLLHFDLAVSKNSDAIQQLSEQYLISMQKLSKWKEFFSFFCISNNVTVLGKETTLFDAIKTKQGFQAIGKIWKQQSYNNERLHTELQLCLEHQQNISAIIQAYDAVISETKNNKMKISITQDFFQI
mgnify:FL=1|jgi:hypothetical protein